MNIKVFDGYNHIDAVPAEDNHIVINGDNNTIIPENSKIWLVEHEATGWWNCDALNLTGTLAKIEYQYSIPKCF